MEKTKKIGRIPKIKKKNIGKMSNDKSLHLMKFPKHRKIIIRCFSRI